MLQRQLGTITSLLVSLNIFVSVDKLPCCILLIFGGFASTRGWCSQSVRCSCCLTASLPVRISRDLRITRVRLLQVKVIYGRHLRAIVNKLGNKPGKIQNFILKLKITNLLM